MEEILCDYFFKNKDLLFFSTVVIVSHTLYYIIVIYFWHNVFKINFYFDALP